MSDNWLRFIPVNPRGNLSEIPCPARRETK
jgi:hypothetical protein